MSTVPRDPKLEPRFGDVFRFGASSSRATAVLYIRPGMGDDWMGLALDSEFAFDDAVQQWLTLDHPEWSFVETIAVYDYAPGGLISGDFSGLSTKNVLRALAIYGIPDMREALDRLRIDPGAGS